MKTRIKLLLTSFAAGVIGGAGLFGCGSGGGSDPVSPAAAPVLAEPPSAVPPVTTSGTASGTASINTAPPALAGVPSTDFETPPGVGSNRRGP